MKGIFLFSKNKKIADENIDLAEYTEDEGEQNSDAGTICKDGTHFCENGAKMLAEYITKTIKENNTIMSKFVK